jgi:hypothetical protein
MVEAQAFFCLCSIYNHVTQVVQTLRFVRLTLKVFMQNYGDTLSVFVIYIAISISEGHIASFFRNKKVRGVTSYAALIFKTYRNEIIKYRIVFCRQNLQRNKLH